MDYLKWIQLFFEVFAFSGEIGRGLGLLTEQVVQQDNRHFLRSRTQRVDVEQLAISIK